MPHGRGHCGIEKHDRADFHTIDVYRVNPHIRPMRSTQRIVVDPARRSGKPCIRNTRITVYDVLEYLASGMSKREILKEFPELEERDILACLKFAADRERRLAGAA
jgi:uncharacterized protein (DUF433 family)